MQAVIGVFVAVVVVLIGLVVKKRLSRPKANPFKVVQTRAELVSEDGQPLTTDKAGKVEVTLKPVRKAKKKTAKKKSKKSKR